MRILLRATLALALALPAYAALAQPAQQQLRVGVPDLPPSRGNPFGGRSVPGSYLWDAIFEPLVRIGANGSPEPVLALSWEVREPTVWRFKLRPNVTFHNGAPFNADAVVATITWLTTQAGKTSSVGQETGILAGATKVDDLTVDIRTNEPTPILPNQLALVSMVEPKLWAEGGAAEFAKTPVGTGPFKLDAFAPGAAELSVYPGAWRKTTLQKVRLVELPERPARLQGLLSGQIDIAYQLSPDQIAELKRANMNAVVTPAPQVMSLAFVTEGRESPVKDARVRLAMNLAVNRQAIADVLLAGMGKPAGQGATPAAVGYNTNLKPMAYDPARAKDLLRQAGFPNGFPLVAEVVVNSFPADSEIYQQMASDLEAVGIKTELRQIRFAEWLQKYNANTWEGAAFGLSWNTTPVMDSIRPFLASFSCLKKPAFFCDQGVLPTIEAAQREFDAKKRLDLLFKLHEETQKNPPALFLVEQIDVTGTSSRVDGFSFFNRTALYDQAKFK